MTQSTEYLNEMTMPITVAMKDTAEFQKKNDCNFIFKKEKEIYGSVYVRRVCLQRQTVSKLGL